MIMHDKIYGRSYRYKRYCKKILKEREKLMKKIITISREFGSGGRELARRLSEELTIAYYDREIITEIAKQTELSESYVQQIVETDSVISFPIHVARSFYVLPDPLEEQNREIFAAQHRIIKEMAEKSDCVIVGRCSDFILKEYRPFRIFVYADMESKIQRCKERTSETELSDSALKKEILKIDKNRAWYYKFYTRQIWGDRLNYDLCINTGGKDIKKIAVSISKFL
ncbi:hypothetical protein HMPREF9554_02219 [Treponema phagedenis F0421]|nr:hypothetical protein HMPREF9554_02219 [Treponema phagedenis F0421]